MLSEENVVGEDDIDKLLPAFIIDPIDGTKDLIRGNGEWSISIAYLNSSKFDDPLNSGWVYQPHLDNLYSRKKSLSLAKSNLLEF